ncbi:MAG: hypothetical protein ACRD3N_04120 [Terracidiphilus sp.]
MKPRFHCSSLFAAALLAALFARPASAATAQFPNGHHGPSHHGPPWSSPVAFSQTIHVGGAAIQIDFAPGPLDLSYAQIVPWVETAARAVSGYYGRFPVPRDRVLIVPAAGRRGVLSGATWGAVDGFPAFHRMRLGQHTTPQDLTADWTMTHEFVHTALPSLADNHHWLEEGLATYVEPIARAQLGTLTSEFVWQETVKGMRQGEPQPPNPNPAHGLDNTHTWASTYWGGALFCMLADIQIREATHNRVGLQTALRGILAAGGSIAVDWPIEKVLAAGDRATGTTVLADLYNKMGKASYAPIDLDALWKRLGISEANGKVVFDNHAPLAPIRQSILTGYSGPATAVSKSP